MKKNPYSDGYNYFNDREPEPDAWSMAFGAFLATLVVCLGFYIYYMESKFEDREVGAVVIEHNVTADRNGGRTYTTIVRTDDGMIEEVTGLSAYTAREGGRLRVKVRREKLKEQD